MSTSASGPGRSGLVPEARVGDLCRVFVVAENEAQTSRIARPVERGGYGLDGLWNDDFHHSCRVAAPGHNEACFADFRGTPQELVSAVKRRPPRQSAGPARVYPTPLQSAGEDRPEAAR